MSTVPLTVQTLTSVRQSDGTMKGVWTADPIKWRANVKQLQGQELFNAQQIQGSATHEVRGRYRPGLVREQRFIKPNGDVLNIISVNDVEDRNLTHIVRCRERT